MEKKKYGPKPRTKNRDLTATRYTSRKATYGTPGERSTPARQLFKSKTDTKTFRPSPAVVNSYRPPVTSATVRPTSTGYVKKSFTPRTPATSQGEVTSYHKTSKPAQLSGGHFAKAQYVSGKKNDYVPQLTKKSTSWSKSKTEKGKFAEKRTPYVPRTNARSTQRSEPYKKPVYKSVVPNRPRTASASWGEVASWYDKHLNEADTYHEKVILPNLIRLIDAEAGDKILDLACGQGFFARALKKTGAHVEGIDIAPELISIAKAETEDIPYHIGSAAKLTMFENETFTKALISLSIQNIEQIDKVIAEAARVLKKGGQLHIVMNHPAFRIPKQSAWGYDDQKKVQFRRVDQYLSQSSTAIDMHPGFSDAPQTISFHRPLQYYFKAFIKSGFAVMRLEEWISHKASDSGPRAKAENDARKEIPLFLYLLIVKQ